MKLAIFSDVHGNPIPLNAVLRDVEQRGGADAYLLSRFEDRPTPAAGQPTR